MTRVWILNPLFPSMWLWLCTKERRIMVICNARRLHQMSNLIWDALNLHRIGSTPGLKRTSEIGVDHKARSHRLLSWKNKVLHRFQTQTKEDVHPYQWADVRLDWLVEEAPSDNSLCNSSEQCISNIPALDGKISEWPLLVVYLDDIEEHLSG